MLIAATCLITALPVWAPTQTFAEKPAGQPNFLFILVDDLGWTDVGCFGSDYYETPNIDRLAAGGMKFTNAYAACQVCSPTRASIMTGRYPARLKLTNYLVGLRTKKGSPILPAPYQHHLPLEEVTIAEALEPAGYTSLHLGKWHLGPEPYYPEQQGFDVNVAGTRAGMPRGFFYPKWKENVPLKGIDGEYLPDALTDRALELLEQNRERPFFMYMAYYAVHIPIQGKKELVEKYQAKEPGKHHDNPFYAAMVDSVDQNVGRLMEKLDALEIADNTVVIFFSDNGGLATPEGPHTPATSNAPLRGGKGQMYEGGIREPLIVRWPGRIEAGSTSDTPVCSIDFYPTMRAMAGAKNKESHEIDGVNILPILTGEGELPPRDLFWHYPHYSNQFGTPSGAIRSGDWKLIERFEDGKLELYDLKKDIGEKQNLADEMPETAKDLAARLAAWRKRVEATMPVRK